MIRQKSVLGYAVSAALLIAGAGCTKYYKIADPTTGKVYYTTDLKQKSGGAAVLKDARTGSQVSLQNSEVTKINKEQFESGKSEAPAPAPAPASQPANPFQ